MAGRWSTHDIELGDGVVVKRFRAHGRDEHRREWRALTLLAEHAPGLAPAPVRADLDADPPVIVMSRLPGEPLRGARVTSAQVTALAAAVTSMHAAVPPARVAELPEAAWTAGRAVALLESYYREGSWRSLGGPAREAFEHGERWLGSSPLTGPEQRGVTPVFGPVDGNLANFLWDGSRVRLVDFEDSGRTDRVFDLATIVEHVSAWVDSTFDAALFLGACGLDAEEAGRLRACRLVAALVWLMMLTREDPAHPRNPPGTLERQALRCLALLEGDQAETRVS